MNWRSMSTYLGISDQTLNRRKIEFGVGNSLTDVMDANYELDTQIQQTLNLTPNS